MPDGIVLVYLLYFPQHKHPIWTAVIQLLAKSCLRYDRLCVSPFLLCFFELRAKTRPLFSSRKPGWNFLLRTQGETGPVYIGLRWRGSVARIRQDEVFALSVWFFGQEESDLWLRRFPCHTKFYGMAGDPPKICPTPICSLSLATVLRLNYRVPVNGVGSTKW